MAASCRSSRLEAVRPGTSLRPHGAAGRSVLSCGPGTGTAGRANDSRQKPHSRCVMPAHATLGTASDNKVRCLLDSGCRSLRSRGRKLTRRRATDRRRRGLADHAAGDAVAGIAGRIAFVIVLAGVDHGRRAAGMEDGIRLAFVEGDGGIDHLDLQRPIRRDVQVRHVAGMTFARQDAMVLVVGVEMRPCRLE